MKPKLKPCGWVVNHSGALWGKHDRGACHVMELLFFSLADTFSLNRSHDDSHKGKDWERWRV